MVPPKINLCGKIYDTIYCGKRFFELACPQNQKAIGIDSSANVITKNQGRWKGGTGEGIAFPKGEGGKGAFFDIREIFKKGPSSETCPPPPTQIVSLSLQKTDIVYSIFSGIISLPISTKNCED